MISVSLDDGQTWTRVNCVRVDPLMEDRELTIYISDEGMVFDDWGKDGELNGTTWENWDDILERLR